MPSQPTPAGITSTKVTNIPKEWDREWFKNFILHHLQPADVRSVSVAGGLTITNYPNTQVPPLLSVGAGAYAPAAEPFLVAATPSGLVTNYRKLAVNPAFLSLADGGALGFMTIGVAAGGIPNSVLSPMSATSIKGNNTGGSSVPLDLTPAQVNAMLPVFTSTLNGLAPLSGGGTTNFLRADGTYAAPAYPTGANPTASVGTAVVNGAAATFMRSDAAPAIDQAMSPAWTGDHSWTKALKFPVFTVATLPANSLGLRAMVSDANAPVFGAAVAGGGAVKVPVYNTGAGWFVG